jgi:hypothetical protein
MTDLDIAGIGVWSPLFADWQAFCDGINDGNWQSNAPLQPGSIPPRERRRAPQSVKMAVEVMDQACSMAAVDPAGVATVFSSAMGDMQITDYLCKVLVAPPRLVSPTRFHNSVHNATTGYWSISRQTHAPTSAVSALEYTAPMAFLEAAVQVAEEELPVLMVSQEMAAPAPLQVICPSVNPVSLALLLTKPGVFSDPVASFRFGVKTETTEWPDLHPDLDQPFKGNFGSRLLPVLTTIASAGSLHSNFATSFKFPLSKSTSLIISLKDKENSTQNV